MTAAFADHVPTQPFTFATVGPSTSIFRRFLRQVYLESHALVSLCFLVTVILLLAYRWNPTEASFKTFLTELAFRRHLKKLNGSTTDRPDDCVEASRSGGLTSESTSPNPPTIGPIFHFSKNATVMLRTPVNIIRSFAFFTIVIVTPVSDLTATAQDRNAACPTVIEGTWYIGAFGHWWVGGVVDLPRFRKQDRKEILGEEERVGLDLKAGLLGFLYWDEPPTPDSATPTTRPAKSPRPKRRRSVARQSVPILKGPAVPPRSTTPPPLPESASLPLHSARMPPGAVSNQTQSSERPVNKHSESSQRHPLPVTAVNAPLLEPSFHRHSLSASHLAMLDQNPAVVDILQQLETSQATVIDLQSQLTSLASTSSTQHQALQNTLQSHREKKQQDDQARSDQKSKMKGCEDAKRSAELAKRDAEKRLKAVQAKHDAALSRIERLSDEIQTMQKTITSDENKVVKSCMEANTQETELNQTMAAKKKELKIAGDVVNALNQRAKEYEAKVKAQQEKLSRVRDVAEERHRKRMAVLHQQQHRNGSQSSLNSRQTSSASSHISPVSPSPIGNQRIHPRTDPLPQQHFFSPVSLNFGPVLSIGQPSFQAGLLQRRNIQDPDRLVLQSSLDGRRQGEPRRMPSWGRNRQRSASLSGNGGVTVETSGTPSFAALTSRFTGRSRNGSAGGMHPAQGFYGTQAGSSGSLDKISPAPSFLARRNSLQSHQRSTFAPFADNESVDSFAEANASGDSESISRFATSLLPSSLVRSLDAESTRSPASERSPYLDYDAYTGVYDQPLEESQLGNGYGRHEWSMTSNGSNSDGPHYDQSMGSEQLSPSMSQTSPIDTPGMSPIQASPVDGVSPRSRFGRFSNGHYGQNRVFVSSQSSFERYASVSTPLETVDENRDAKHRRWFPSFINSQAGQLAVFPQNDPTLSLPKSTKSKSGLNPDAKSFTLSRRRTSIGNDNRNVDETQDHHDGSQVSPISLSSGPTPLQAPSLASRMYGSLTQTRHRHAPSQDRATLDHEDDLPPAPATPTGNFFSSLLAFAPSPAERQALQKGMESASAAAANKVALVGKDGFTKGAVHSESQDSLPVLAPPWSVQEIQASTDNLPTPTPATASTTKRSLSSLWSRNKPTAKNSTTPAEESAVSADKPVENEPRESPTVVKEDAPASGFGSRFARFTRHGSKAAIEAAPITATDDEE